MIKLDRRTLLAILHDLLAVALAWSVALLLRFNFEPPLNYTADMTKALVWVVPLHGLVFWYWGLYRGLWRYASMNDLRQIFFAIILSNAISPLVLWMASSLVVPRSVLVMAPVLLLFFMAGSRIFYRLWKEKRLHQNIKLRGEPVLVLGAGDAAMSLSQELARSNDWYLVGFLDDDASKQGRVLNGTKVLGTLNSLPYWIQTLGVTQSIIAMPKMSHKQRRRAIEICNQAGVSTLMVPSFEDLMSGRVSISQLHTVEIEDLLGRDPVQLDDAGLHVLLTDQVVMITGAGGSIGSELCRQIAGFKPKLLLLFDQGEFALYTIEQELSKNKPELKCEYIIGDVCDVLRLDEVMSKYLPAVVFHAAAYKHVPLMERNNAWQAVQNNVRGTWNVASAAQKYDVLKFVQISTDKAVNPTNVMGATKRLAEIVCLGLQRPSGTQFIMVRFGNVLGSNGSVIPKFREQIAQGGPVTVTHPDITRYFMSIPEAAQLVMQAGLMGRGGEIFVLDMGESVKIVNLAKDLIRLSGLTENEIAIEFTGLRPGEKLYEELLADDEKTLPTSHQKLRIAKMREVEIELLDSLLSWVVEPVMRSDAEVKDMIVQWLPEYLPDRN